MCKFNKKINFSYKCISSDTTYTLNETVPAHQTTGSGIFLNPSHGIFIEGKTISGSDDLLGNVDISLTPNPASDFVIVSSEIKPDRIEIFDILGRSVLVKREGLHYSTELDISNLPSSNYFIKIFTKAGVVMQSVTIK